MKTLSIRWKLSLFFAAAVAVILVVFGIILILITRQYLLNRTDTALREELREILLEAKLHNSVDDFQTAAQTRFYSHDVYNFVVVDHQNSIVFEALIWRWLPAPAGLRLRQSLSQRVRRSDPRSPLSTVTSGLFVY